MKIVISYFPLPNTEHLGRPQVQANRQFQWFSEPTQIYPTIMAYAATMLKEAGHEVVWLDGLAEGWNWDFFYSQLIYLKPDIILTEVKTPTVKRVWPLIDELKKWMPETVIVLCGDHPTALPEESLENCNVDIILTGGDYDFGLLNIVKHLEAKDLEKQPEWVDYNVIQGS